MTEQGSGGLLGRRRRANAGEGERRSKRYPVTVTRAEDAVLTAKARAAGMSVPRLLHESALAANVETSTERKGAIAELFQLRRAVGSIANNVNQLAKFANTEGTFAREAEAVVAEFRELYPRISEAVKRLADT